MVASTRVITFAFIFAGLVQAQVQDVAGEWQVPRRPLSAPASSPLEEWLNALPGAVLTLSHSVVPPLAMVRKDLTSTYFPSLPIITISGGASVAGFLQLRTGRLFEGELASGPCWMHLSLEESQDGSILVGSARINTKISTRACRNLMAKGFKNGEPFGYALVRLKR